MKHHKVVCDRCGREAPLQDKRDCDRDEPQLEIPDDWCDGWEERGDLCPLCSHARGELGGTIEILIDDFWRNKGAGT